MVNTSRSIAIAPMGVFLGGLGMCLALLLASNGESTEDAHAPAFQSTTASLGPRPAASPEEAYTRFRQALVAENWRDEYECYSPKAQTRFSYIVVLCALYLEYETDLFLQVEGVLANHGIPDIDLAQFWPNPTRAIITRENQMAQQELEAAAEDWHDEYEQRLKRWSLDVFPKIEDCPQLIAELQPLILTSVERRPTSTVAQTVAMFSRHAYGRIRELRVDGDRATASIRTKTLDGYYVESDALERCAGLDVDSAEKVEQFCNIVLLDANAYTEIWETALELQSLAKTLPPSRQVVIGMGTGDLAVELLDDELYIGDGQRLQMDDDDSQEFDWANTGTRTVSAAEVHFRNCDGRWLIDAIDYR